MKVKTQKFSRTKTKDTNPKKNINPRKSKKNISSNKVTKPAKDFALRKDVTENNTISDEIIYGRKPVMEALRKGQGINKVLFARGASGSLTQIKAMAREAGIPLKETDPDGINKLAPGAAHQGVIAYVAPVAYREADEMITQALKRYADTKQSTEAPLFMLLDGLEDPHNLGAILRSVDGAGGNGVFIPKRRAVPLTAAVAKISAGAVQYVPVARVTNIARTLDDLKEQGIWIVGTDAEAGQDYWSADFKRPVAIVIGSEGKGISRLVKEKCDYLVRIPMSGKVASLNASVSAALLLYEIIRQRSRAGEM